GRGKKTTSAAPINPSKASRPMPPLPTRDTTPMHCSKNCKSRTASLSSPPKKNRKLQRGYDKDLYIERNLIERFFNKLKQFRRVATRYDKLLANFMGFVKIAAIAIWIK
ncbi:MAG: transposase, partial [Methylocystis sp.]|nr:transposase [Methylocystis sp.]